MNTFWTQPLFESPSPATSPKPKTNVTPTKSHSPKIPLSRASFLQRRTILDLFSASWPTKSTRLDMLGLKSGKNLLFYFSSRDLTHTVVDSINEILSWLKLWYLGAPDIAKSLFDCTTLWYDALYSSLSLYVCKSMAYMVILSKVIC